MILPDMPPTPPECDRVFDGRDLHDTFLNTRQPLLPSDPITIPYDYVASLPSKGRRSLFTKALNQWLKIQESDLREIDQIIEVLHNASLMVDDVQDASNQRRGHPSTHIVFGIGQTINSAMYHINEAIVLTQRLCGPEGVSVVLAHLSTLYTGQGYDILSSQNMTCPTLAEYISTLDGKTGALFQMTAELMFLKSQAHIELDQLRRLVTLFGRYYQLRDDYLNLQPIENTADPSVPWCDDLDSGKYTLPLIHLLESGRDNYLIRSLLSARHASGEIANTSKCLLIARMAQAGSFDYTLQVANAMQKEMLGEIEQLDRLFGTENTDMTLLVSMLKL